VQSGQPVTPAIDVTQTPEYKAAVAKAAADADAKARLGTAEKARQSVMDELATALGLKPKDVDPAAVGAELAEARKEIVTLRTDAAVSTAARKLGGDEDMVTAWLSHKGKLKDLDPAASDFAGKVEAIVKAEIEANPKLKSAAPAAPPAAPGTLGASSTGMAGGAGEGNRTLGLGSALAAAQRR
jgi:hypothetical protein